MSRNGPDRPDDRDCVICGEWFETNRDDALCARCADERAMDVADYQRDAARDRRVMG